MDYKFKDDLVREYGYDKVIRKINKELKKKCLNGVKKNLKEMSIFG